MRSLTWAEVRSRRVGRQCLTPPASRDALVDVVGAIGGVHAPVLSSAELSLGLRVADTTARDIRAQLFEHRQVVRTYGIRGTVHLFPSDELPMWLAALRANVPPRSTDQTTSLTTEQTIKIVDAIADALDGRILTRQELVDAVAQRLGSWVLDEDFPALGGTWPKWRAALSVAGVAGALCFGRESGGHITYVRPDQWVERWYHVDERQALAEVLRRYLAVYGPATAEEFAQWFHMKASAARELLPTLTGEVEPVDVEGRTAWQLSAEPDHPEPESSVHLLPRFDSYLVGSFPRDQLVSAEVLEKARAHPSAPRDRSPRAMFAGPMPVLLVDGRCAGFWQWTRSDGGVDIRVQPYVELDRRQQRALDLSAVRVGEVLGADVTLAIGDVQTSLHL